MIVGAGATLRGASTGVIGATCVDLDGDGTCEVTGAANTNVAIDANDDGTAEFRFTDPGSGLARLESTRDMDLLVPGGSDFFRWIIGGGVALFLRPGGLLQAGGRGTAGGPAYSFDADPNTGVYSPSADSVALAAGGVAQLSVTTTTVSLAVAQVNTHASRTCADSGDGSPGFLAVTTSGASYLPLTGNDPHGCTASLSETGAVDGQRLEVVLVATAGGTVDFADSSGIQETGAGCSLSLHGSATFRRMSDRWTLTGCIPSN
jgi:hypothetical protein